ncbi:Transmembrane protein 70 mitochondrial [Clonorchis sinensis]|uniref:Transmembrane protein 70 mitochondrial n=1 Tax=Clonorchis sinensis TaxID=79923 RepID=A0A8T1M3T5_CLOSI|nr:Transmembrane protein 70 mitochondrial [Clonorchis sinensis]
MYQLTTSFPLLRSGCLRKFISFSYGCRLSSSSGHHVTTGDLVYKSPNRNVVFSCVLLFQPFIVMKLSNPGLLLVAVLSSLSFAVTTPLLLHIITRSHVSELYFDKNTEVFTAFTRGILLNKKRIEFTAEEVTCTEGSVSMANINVRGVPLFVSETDFEDQTLYKKLMGFDKPLKLR